MKKNNQKKREPLYLNDYCSIVKEIYKLRNDLNLKLRPIIFSFDTMQDLYYEALKHIHPINKRVKNNQKSILLSIEEVLNHFKLLNRKVLITKRTEKNDDSIKLFQRWIIGYETLPKHQLENLQPNVEKHLKDINELIKHYEKQAEVNNFLLKREIRHDHKTKTILDFYIRCLKERQDILDYYLYGIYDRANEKAHALLFKFSLDFLEIWKDYPYETGSVIFGRTIDYRQIDCMSHRIEDIRIDELPLYKKLYDSNKDKFYRELFKRKSKEQVFQNIFHNLNFVPLIKNREPLFDELKNLFFQRKWLAFYALALPQVEGLFSEMVASANPKSVAISKALPDKVKAVRPDYSFSSSSFDYYEYELPNQRNSFSHTGYTDGYKLKAFDILTDLEHVLSIFASLKNPLVNLIKTIKRHDQFHFSNYEAFNNYFLLLDRLHPEQKANSELKQNIKDFGEEFLKQHCSLEYIIQEAAKEIKTICTEIKINLNNSLSKFDFPKNWKVANKQKLIKLLQNSDFEDQARNTFLSQNEKIEIIFTLRDFFYGVQKHLYKKTIPLDLENEFAN